MAKSSKSATTCKPDRLKPALRTTAVSRLRRAVFGGGWGDRAGAVTIAACRLRSSPRKIRRVLV